MHGRMVWYISSLHERIHSLWLAEASGFDRSQQTCATRKYSPEQNKLRRRLTGGKQSELRERSMRLAAAARWAQGTKRKVMNTPIVAWGCQDGWPQAR